MSYLLPPALRIKSLVGLIRGLNVVSGDLRYEGMHIEHSIEMMHWVGLVRGGGQEWHKVIFDDQEMMDIPDHALAHWVDHRLRASYRKLKDNLTESILETTKKQMMATEQQMAINGIYNTGTATASASTYTIANNTNLFLANDLIAAHQKTVGSVWDSKLSFVDILRDLNQGWTRGVPNL